MAPRTLAGLSTVLAAAGNTAEALNALAQDVMEHDKNGHVVLLIYDAKRDLLAERLIPAHAGTRALNDEHSRAVAELQHKLSEAQAALGGKGAGDSIRVSQLKRAIEVAAVEARATAQRLSAVEEQVRVAVTKLEKAHIQLHTQGEALQTQSNIIYRVEQALREAMAGQDSQKVIEEVLQIVASREQASPF